MAKDLVLDPKNLIAEADPQQTRLDNLAKHRERIAKASLFAGGGVGALLTMLYGVVLNFRNQLNAVPVPFNFIIFPALGVLSLVLGVLSVTNAVLARKQGARGAAWHTALADAIFNSADGLGTAGIIIAGFIAPGVILPILPYVFIAIMGAQLVKKVVEIAVHLRRGPESKSPAHISAHRHHTATQVAGASSFVLGIASVGLIMAAGIHILAPLGIIGGLFLVGFMGALYAKGKMAKKAAPAKSAIESSDDENESEQENKALLGLGKEHGAEFSLTNTQTSSGSRSQSESSPTEGSSHSASASGSFSTDAPSHSLSRSPSSENLSKNGEEAAEKQEVTSLPLNTPASAGSPTQSENSITEGSSHSLPRSPSSENLSKDEEKAAEKQEVASLPLSTPAFAGSPTQSENSITEGSSHSLSRSPSSENLSKDEEKAAKEPEVASLPLSTPAFAESPSLSDPASSPKNDDKFVEPGTPVTNVAATFLSPTESAEQASLRAIQSVLASFKQ